MEEVVAKKEVEPEKKEIEQEVESKKEVEVEKKKPARRTHNIFGK